MRQSRSWPGARLASLVTRWPKSSPRLPRPLGEIDANSSIHYMLPMQKMKKVLYIAIFYCILSCNLLAAEKCNSYFSMEDPEQALFSYIYIAGHEPWIFDETIKTNEHNDSILKIIHDNLNNNFGNKIDTLFAFNKNIYILQGNKPMQFAVPPLNSAWRTPQPDGSVFIITDSPNFPNKIITIISSVSPVTLKILLIDRCDSSVKLVFDSFDFDFMHYNKSPQMINIFYDPMRRFPIKKVTINKNLTITLYEFKTNYVYVANDLIEAYPNNKYKSGP